MRPNEIHEIAELSIPEKILLVEDLWDDIGADEKNIPVPQSHREEIDRRLGNHLGNPGRMLSLDELQARVERRK